MYEESLNDALNMALGVETTPEFVDAGQVEFASTELATWCFETIARMAEENPEGIPEDAQISTVRNAVAAAYIAGCLDSSNQPAEASHTVTGKSGAIYNFYFN
jgi:hypothetical protein